MWTAENRAFIGDFGAGQGLSDEQYALLAPLIPPAKPGGRPRTTDMRRLLDGLFYLVRTGWGGSHRGQPRWVPGCGVTCRPRPPSRPGEPCTATCARSRTRACGRAYAT